MRLPRILNTRVRVAGAVVAAAVLVPTTAALAIVGGFTDVPDGHSHAAGIGWVADNDITSGCTATTYCPSDFVTRAQMATFMQRLAGHAAGVAPSVDADTIDGLDSTELLALGGGGTPASPVGVATSAASFTSSDSASWIDVPGASTSLTVPAGFTATAVATFTAESVCTGTDWCSARILIDGVPAAPAAGTDYAFDSSDAGTETGDSWESRTMQQVVAGLAAGPHDVKVQIRSVGGSTLRLDDFTLTAIGHLG